MILIPLILIFACLAYWWLFHTCCSPEPQPNGNELTKTQRLADPNLLYFSSWWSGLCRNSHGEEGGCYGEMYFYSTGKFVKKSGWVGLNDRKEINPTVENQFSTATVSDIIQKIRTSGLIIKNCYPQEIMDAGWDYQINLDGVKKSFHNPPEDCESTFNYIDDIIDPNVPTFQKNNINDLK